jgi:hypothetical protein
LARDAAARLIGADAAQKLVHDNPEAVLNNRSITASGD